MSGAAWPERLRAWLEARQREFEQIDPARRVLLQELAAAVRARLAASGRADLVFVCTHNSRRSQFGQVWAQVAADWHGLAGVRAFSGGTEVTACAPGTLDAFRRVGLDVELATDDLTNPVWHVAAGAASESRCWSKRVADPANPDREFIAVMTCASADEACPLVPGAAHRLAVRYADPKVADGTPREDSTYDARCAEIAREMLYAMSSVRAG